MLATIALLAGFSPFAGAAEAPPKFDYLQAQRTTAYMTLERCEDWEHRNTLENGVKVIICDFADRAPGCYRIVPSVNQGYCYAKMRGHVRIGPRKGQTRECISTEIYYTTVWHYAAGEPRTTRTKRTNIPGTNKLIPWKWECHWGINA